MSRRGPLLAALVALVLLLACPVEGWAQGDLPTLLARQAPLEVDDGPEPWTGLVIPTGVMEQSQPDLSDVRLFDHRGVEVPFVIVGGTDEPLQVMLDRLSVEQRADHTHLVVRLPAGLAVERLVLTTTTPSFDRSLEVRDVGPGGGGRAVGAGRIHRRPGDDASVVVPVRGPRGDALEIVVSDGDSPPLENLVVVAEVERPILMSPLSGRGTLRFGGGRLSTPRYDLSHHDAERALDASAARVRWAEAGEARDNPGFDPLPALAFAMKPGAPAPLGRFRHRRPLTITPSREGLSVLSLDVSDLAHARVDLGDLRVVDDRGRQLPHLIERTGRRLRAPLTLEPPSGSSSTRTIHRFSLPGPSLPLSAVELVLSSTFAHRAYRIVAGEGDEAITLAAGHLRRRPGDPPSLVVELGEVEPVASLALEVEDGDDAPLSLVAATALVPGAELFVVAPQGRYWLMSGARDLAPPRYEIERARPMVLSLSRETIVTGPREQNPAFVSPPSDQPPPILWAVIGLAVAVLGWLTLRVVAEEQPDEPVESLNA